MNLDLFNNFANEVKEHSFTLKFIDELTTYLNNAKKDILEKQINQDLADFLSTDELISKYKISSTRMEDFFQKCNEILEKYSKTLDNQENIYYVSRNNNIDNKYTAYNIYTINQYSNGRYITDFKLYGKELPENVQKGMIIKNNGNKYEIDSLITNAISKELQKATEDLANIQNSKLQKYRKEDHLYVVIERNLHSAYLQDIDTNVVFEEVNFSDDVFNSLYNDVVVRYKDGEYIVEEEITNEWFDSFISIDEHKQALTELLSAPNFSNIDFENTSFNILSRGKHHTLLSFGENNKNTLKVPNKLISYWVNDDSILYYDKVDKLFYKQV